MRFCFSRSLATLFVPTLFLASLAHADIAIPTPPPNRAALVDAILVGEVIALEEKFVEVAPAPGSPKVPHLIAVVRVSDQVLGPKEAKLARVAFLQPIKPGELPGRRPVFALNLKIGAEGLFFLTQPAKEDFFVAPMFYDFVSRADPGFANELKEARANARLLEAPLVSLKSPDAEVRFRTAALVIARHRTPRVPDARGEPVGEEESKLLLKAILDARWDAPHFFNKPHPWLTFNQLGLTPKDGWSLSLGGAKGVKTQEELFRGARAWLEKNWQTYRIQRFPR